MSQTLPLVSVIVPVYNAAPDLARCIESIRRQSWPALEILLVNDGSSDASGPICEMYARVDSRIHILTLPNGGVSAARNAAIRQAAGKYLQFVDSDDYLSPEATRLLAERAEETQADLVISHYWRVIGECCTEHGLLEGKQLLSQLDFARSLMEQPASFYYGVMWNKLYRSDLVQKHGIQCDPSLGWSEDFLFNLEYIRYADRFATLPDPIYYYIKRETSITATRINLRSLFETKRSLFRYYKELYTNLGLYDQYKRKIYKYLIASAEHR